MSVSRLFHTLRRLRARQLAWQLRSRLGAAFERPAARAQRPVPPDPGRRWRPRCDFPPPGPQRHRPEELRAGAFTFLNRSERLGWPPRWTNPELPRLWEYNLHYFEYLWALPYEDARCVVRDWVARHGLARGRVGWEPYPTSLRLLNWCAYFYGRHRERSEADRELRADLWASIQLQADWLAGHPEYHLLGNHLLENGAALAFCGACFGGAQAQAWLRSGVEILTRELAEQVLPDGGHFERSPMYHVRVASLLRLLGATGHPELERLVAEPQQRMLRALEALQHPDGEIALLNDSAFGIADRPDALCDSTPAPGPFALPDTGYYGARSDEGDYVVCDAAPIGPDSTRPARCGATAARPAPTTRWRWTARTSASSGRSSAWRAAAVPGTSSGRRATAASISRAGTTATRGSRGVPGTAGAFAGILRASCWCGTGSARSGR
jgi:uncharacterized heparinase superfamily protein